MRLGDVAYFYLVLPELQEARANEDLMCEVGREDVLR